MIVCYVHDLEKEKRPQNSLWEVKRHKSGIPGYTIFRILSISKQYHGYERTVFIIETRPATDLTEI